MPHGSNARPVQPVKEGGMLLGGNMSVPFALVGNLAVGKDNISASNFAESFTYTPGLSFDYSLNDEGMLLGAGISYLSVASLPDDGKHGSADLGFVFFSPRMEIPLTDAPRNLALTIDVSMMFLVVTGDQSGASAVPLPMPSLGLRYYHAIGNGGLVISQAVGTSFLQTYFPGSIAYDIAIGNWHIMPEIKWDPSYINIGEDDDPNDGAEEFELSAFTAWFSAGVAVMYQF